MTTYVLAGGCFWCLDATYRRIKGVTNVVSGYSGGDLQYPTYNQVSSGVSGHAECIQVTFDEAVIPTQTILDLFFTIHNPTTKNQQGADIGTQYRSAFFYANDTQKQAFTQAIKRAQPQWDNPIVTEITQLTEFYPAEDYHQDYFAKNPESGYCHIVITPKLTKARAHFKEWFL